MDIFWLDKTVIGAIYGAFKFVGGVFYLGAFEGAVICVGVIVAGVMTYFSKGKKVVKK